MQTQENQTLFDIALQEYGTAEAAFELSRTNNISISDIIPAGTEIMLPENATNNKQILSFYKSNNIQPATGTNQNFNKFIWSAKGIPITSIRLRIGIATIGNAQIAGFSSLQNASKTLVANVSGLPILQTATMANAIQVPMKAKNGLPLITITNNLPINQI